MVSTPTYLAATSGSPSSVGQINQFLTSHTGNLLYQGVLQSSQTTAGTGTADSSVAWYSQTITTTSVQTAIGLVLLRLTSSGTGVAPMQMQLYADSGGLPTGSALFSVNAATEYVAFAPAYVTFPMPMTVTPSTTYHLAIPMVGNITNQYHWGISNQTSGAASSPDGVTWTAQTYGLLYEVYDQTTTGLLQCTYNDGGNRWTWQLYNATSHPTELCEFTQGQTSTTYVQSNRTISYTGGLITGIA